MSNLSDQRLSVSVREAAAMIGVGRTAMYGLISDGSVKSSRVGGRRIVLVSSLRTLVGELDRAA